MSIYEIVKSRRRVLGMTAKEFGEKAGCSESYVYDLEHGRRQIPLKYAGDWAHAMAMSTERVLELIVECQLRRAGLKQCVYVMKPVGEE